jgi:hypothetical protein
LLALSNSDSFSTIRQNIKSLGPGRLQGFTIPEDLHRTLEDIEEMAGRVASARNHLSTAELAFVILTEWYDDFGLEHQQRREAYLIKVGGIFEINGWKDRAEGYSLKIFDFLVVAPADLSTPFHHAIRNYTKKVSVGKDALMRIIRCCPLCRFKLRNREGQTPLSLAVSINEEEIVVAMIKRLRDPQRPFPIDPIILDARDCYGRTILTNAIIAGCSLPLVDALIQCGFEVNPPTWPEGPLTPLQAASFPGCERVDLAWLLLQHQANPCDIFSNSDIAVLLARGPLPRPTYVPLLPELDRQP